jgi:hypothetical protein
MDDERPFTPDNKCNLRVMLFQKRKKAAMETTAAFQNFSYKNNVNLAENKLRLNRHNSAIILKFGEVRPAPHRSDDTLFNFPVVQAGIQYLDATDPSAG